MLQTAALISAAPEFQNLDGSCYPVLQEEKIVFRESFRLRDVVGEGGEFSTGKFSEYLGNSNPTSEEFLYCVSTFL